MADMESPRAEHALLPSMPGVLAYRDELKSLNRQWIRTTLTGKINSTRVASTLIEFMEGTQSKFLTLQDKLIHALASENCRKVVREMAGLSRVAIDILKRNLFERTADVGFLATDDDIVEFLRREDAGEEETARIEARLRAYRDKYTVYEEIVVFDIFGNVRAHLDASSAVARSEDPLLRLTLAADGYRETFGPSDIRPGKGDALIYSHRILGPDTGEPLGVLCLCFDLTGEMEGIYKNLLQNQRAIVCILDEQGKVISSSDPGQGAPGSALPMALDREYDILGRNGDSYLVKTTRTNGYQGFFGLPWFGHVMYPVAGAFREQTAGSDHGLARARDTTLFAGTLKEIDDDADDILSDLGLVVLNGEVMAAKQLVSADPVIQQEANALPPVLGAIHQVGEKIRSVFAESIFSLLHTVLSAKLDDARFFASLAIDIMDRNLYERANDCRWWALNSLFRAALSDNNLGTESRQRMGEVLAYINSLYTVYSNLMVYDARGVVQAVSDPAAAGRVGRTLEREYVQRSLQLRDPQQYHVSEFRPFEEYPDAEGAPRPTYIYNAAIMHRDRADEAVGGIAIVFDSEPQFKAMLEDALPRDEQGHVQPGSSAFFIDPERRVISSTNPRWRPGDILPLDQNLPRPGNGEHRSEIITLGGKRCLMGCATSSGYREYKRDGAYTNDVTAVVLVEA